MREKFAVGIKGLREGQAEGWDPQRILWWAGQEECSVTKYKERMFQRVSESVKSC